jgi:hypothetical protein
VGNDTLVAYKIATKAQECERYKRSADMKENGSGPFKMASILKIECGIILVMKEGACQVYAIDGQPRLLDSVVTDPSADAESGCCPQGADDNNGKLRSYVCCYAWSEPCRAPKQGCAPRAAGQSAPDVEVGEF